MISCKCKKIKKYEHRECVLFKNLDNHLHNLDGPAEIYFYKNLIKIKCISYYIGGLQHREGDLPAYIYYNTNGVVLYESFHKYGRYHRDIGPARIWYKKGRIESQEFWKNGFLVIT